MKHLAAIIILSALVWSCNSPDSRKEKAQQEINMEEVTAVTFQVTGMTCTGCENAINTNVEELEGIVEVSSSHTDSFTTVKFDQTLTTLEEIKKAIEEKGYQVTGHSE